MPSKDANDTREVTRGMEPRVAPSRLVDSDTPPGEAPGAAKVEVHGSGPRMAPPKPQGSRKPPGHRLPGKPE